MYPRVARSGAFPYRYRSAILLVGLFYNKADGCDIAITCPSPDRAGGPPVANPRVIAKVGVIIRLIP